MAGAELQPTVRAKKLQHLSISQQINFYIFILFQSIPIIPAIVFLGTKMHYLSCFCFQTRCQLEPFGSSVPFRGKRLWEIPA